MTGMQGMLGVRFVLLVDHRDRVGSAPDFPDVCDCSGTQISGALDCSVAFTIGKRGARTLAKKEASEI